MRIKKTETRERKWENLREATGEGHTSQALDVAADYYLKMAGGTEVDPTGQLVDLLAAAEERGSLTGDEIVEILHTDELPLDYETDWSVGVE